MENHRDAAKSSKKAKCACPAANDHGLYRILADAPLQDDDTDVLDNCGGQRTHAPSVDRNRSELPKGR